MVNFSHTLGALLFGKFYSNVQQHILMTALQIKNQTYKCMSIVFVFSNFLMFCSARKSHILTIKKQNIIFDYFTLHRNAFVDYF